MSTTLVKVMQCDRCMSKHEFVLDGYDDISDKDKLFKSAILDDHNYGKLQWSERPNPAADEVSHSYDLCKKCADQLSNWFDSCPLRKTE